MDRGNFKVNYLLKQNCRIEENENKEKIILTNEGKYIDKIKDILRNYDCFTTNTIYRNHLVYLQSAYEEDNLCDIGFDKVKQEWYCWNNGVARHIGIGFEAFKNSLMDFEPHSYPYLCETLEQAFMIACDFVKLSRGLIKVKSQQNWLKE